ncbi:MAG: molybdopterin-binding protein [Planctomycetota bacterium]
MDTNSQWLSQRLGDLGVEVRFHTTVADDLEANAEVFRAAVARTDVVVATGGLGPTADDLTREALAAAAGVGLVRDDAIVQHIRRLFSSRGRTMPEQNKRQADFPQGALAIANPNGTAPGVQMAVERVGRPACLIFALPGVPAEMHEMWQATVAPAIEAAAPAKRVIRHRRLKCFGVGESHLEAMLPDVIRRGREPRVGITVSGATITLRVTSAAEDEASAYAAMQPTLALMREKLGVLVFGEEDDELQHAVSRLLGDAGKTIATAESWSEGLMAGWLVGAGVASESRVVASPSVGEPAVAQLAAGLRQESGADFALAIGTPDNGEPEQVAFALANDATVMTREIPLLGHPTIHRPRIAKAALNLLRLHLLNHE